MQHTEHYNLRALARRAMIDAGFSVALSPEASREARQLDENASSNARDLRAWLWSSIDNPESRDLDQLEFVEAGPGDTLRLLIAVADVDAFAPRGSALDRHAFANTTSVYTGVETFPMLPVELSEDASSLLESEDRLAVVVDLVVDVNGEVRSADAFRARVRNHAKLTYETVGPWLEGSASLPRSIGVVPGLEAQLWLQNEVAERLGAVRRKRGALDFDTIEARPVVENGTVVNLSVPVKNRARYLIESFMVAVNGAVADLLRERGLASIQRVVRAPRRWDRITQIAAGLNDPLPTEPDARALAGFLARRRQADPLHFPDLSLSIVKLLGAGEYAVVGKGAEEEEHFGLAVQGYSHSTAPNRRYADLATQRLLKSVLDGSPAPYTLAELEAIAARCNERASAANKVERRMRKTAAAVFLRARIGQVFNALVTGASDKGTYVRLLDPPAEGRVVHGEDGLDVGDAVRVRLVSTNPDAGFIDFERE